MSTENVIELSDAKSALGEDPESQILGNEVEGFDKYTFEKGQHQQAETYEIDSDVETDARRYPLWELIKFVANFNKEETLTMLWGLFFSIITGAGNPT
jgi:ATP-binding cassette subfamily B (MDR/TAP) protein 1